MKFRLVRASIGLLVFAASGAAGLIYQVAWQRWVTLTTGVGAVSAAIVVAAFLAGLSLGAMLGGVLADRVGPRRGWLVFAGLELLVGGLALGSVVVLHDWLPQVPGLGPEAPLRAWAVLFLVLAAPTVPMGMALPVLATAVRHSTPLKQAGLVSRLFFANTLGAAAGACLVALVLAPAVGFDGAVAVGAMINAGCAVVAAGLFFTVAAPAAPAGGWDEAAGEWPSAAWWGAWGCHHVLAGFALLVYELVAFRVLEHIVKARSFTFGILLAALLGGYAVGAWIGDRQRPRPAHARRTLFFGTQVALAITVMLAPALLWWGLALWPGANVWAESMASTEPVWSTPVLLLNYLVAPLVLLVGPGVLMGFSFSITQQLVHTDLATVGRRLGALQALAAVGSVGGAWFVTQWGFPVFGTVRSLQLLGVVGLGYGLVWIARTRSRRAVAATAGVLLVLLALPSPAEFWRVLSGSPSPDRWLWHEGRHGVSVIAFDDDADPRAATVYASGIGQSRLPRAAHPVHVTLGAVPVLAHPAPRRVGIIGLGSGATAWAASARPETERVTVWELFAGQQRLLTQYADRTADRSVDWFVRDPRVAIRQADGRRGLRLSDQPFDVIEADALRPESALAGHLYSVEFFSLVRSRLAPGGLAATWIPTPRVLASFRQVFPQVVVVGRVLALGSDTPIETSWEVLRARARTPAVQAHFRQGGVDLEAVLEPVVAPGPTPWPDLPRRVNTDMHPIDEMPSAAAWYERFLTRKPR